MVSLLIVPYIPLLIFFQQSIINEKEKDHSLVVSRGSIIKSNHHKLEDNKAGHQSTTATAKKLDDEAAVSLSLNSNTSQLFWLTKAGNNSDANDVSLELTLA